MPAGTWRNYRNLGSRRRSADLLPAKWTHVSMNWEAGWAQDPLWTRFGEYKTLLSLWGNKSRL